MCVYIYTYRVSLFTFRHAQGDNTWFFCFFLIEFPGHGGREGNNGFHRVLYTSQGRLQVVGRTEEVEGNYGNLDHIGKIHDVTWQLCVSLTDSLYPSLSNFSCLIGALEHVQARRGAVREQVRGDDSARAHGGPPQVHLCPA